MIYCTQKLIPIFVAVLTELGVASWTHAEDAEPVRASVTVEADRTLREMDPRRLGGTNVAMWYYPSVYASPIIRGWMAELRAANVRMPGGTWSNAVYWNGNGVRLPDGSVDTTKVGADGYPAVDYKDYARSFLADSKTLHPASGGWHGHTDVKTQHEFIKDISGTEAMVCPNLGTGRAVDAAEWVRWANKKMGYNVRIWEIGNELGGSWEPGTELPFGKGQLTGEMYSRRFNEMADAMRAVDPTIKIGGGAFVEAMLRDCGENVDFASIHTYPGSATQTDRALFSEIGPGIRKQVAEVKAWIHQYQPQRQDKIELAYSEWNTGFSLNGRDMFGGVWASIFLGELAHAGVDMAQQWDCFAVMLEVSEEKGCARLAQYYALWLWNNYMGDKLLPAATSDPSIYTYASRTDDAVAILLVNTNRERIANVNVNLKGFDGADAGELATIGSREYYWNELNGKAQWSTGPRIERLATGENFPVKLSPFSMTCVRVPTRSKPELSSMAQKALAAPAAPAHYPEIRFVMPQEIFVGDRVSGTLIALDAGTEMPHARPLAPAKMSASGEVQFERAEVRLDDPVGHFHFTVATPGELTLTATTESTSTSRKLLVKPSVPRPVVFWDFDKPKVNDAEVFGSSYKLVEDLNQRPNRAVARVDLSGQVGVGHQDTGLFSVGKLPDADKLDKTNIRGVIVDVMTSPDLTCEDSDAHIMVVMQSSANWWMHLGSIPLKPGMDWKSHQFEVKLEDHIKAMPAAHNILFVLQAKKPVKGSAYFDKIGFMVR